MTTRTPKAPLTPAQINKLELLKLFKILKAGDTVHLKNYGSFTGTVTVKRVELQKTGKITTSGIIYFQNPTSAQPLYARRETYISTTQNGIDNLIVTFVSRPSPKALPAVMAKFTPPPRDPNTRSPFAGLYNSTGTGDFYTDINNYTNLIRQGSDRFAQL